MKKEIKPELKRRTGKGTRTVTDPRTGKQFTQRVAAPDDPIYSRGWTVGSLGVSRKKK